MLPLLIGSQDVVTYMLIMLNVMFFIIIFIYYILKIERRKVKYATFIKGTWRRQGTGHDGSQWHISYTFTDKTFEINAVPDLYITGKYKIIKEIEQLLIIQLFDVTGTTEDLPKSLQIGVDHISNQLTIDHRVYKRTK